jgi:hypothetical protein
MSMAEAMTEAHIRQLVVHTILDAVQRDLNFSKARTI